MNYGDLNQAIQDYVQTSEATFTGHINDFVRTAEDRVYRSVQMPAFWKSTAVGEMPDSTSVTIDGAIEIYSVRVSKNAGETTGEWTYLLKKDWDFLLEAYPGDGTAVSTGIPKYYAIGSALQSSSKPQIKIEVAPKPTVTSDVPPKKIQYSVDYYGKIASDSITDGGASKETWLSVTFPDVLLHGSLAEAYGFMKGEPGMIQYYETLFNQGMATMGATITGEQATVSTPGAA